MHINKFKNGQNIYKQHFLDILTSLLLMPGQIFHGKSLFNSIFQVITTIIWQAIAEKLLFQIFLNLC